MSALRRVIAGVSGSPRNLPALRYAAALAYDQDATLIPVHAWVPVGGELAYSRHPSIFLLEEGRKAAEELVNEALATAFGSVPAGSDTQPLIARGAAGRVLTGIAHRAGDLLIIGSGRRGTIGRLAGGRVSRYCLAHADCPVLAVPPSSLVREAGHGLHGWVFRHWGRDPDKLTAGS
jgi:nucleotide-binding universal stress UspA family protein